VVEPTTSRLGESGTGVADDDGFTHGDVPLGVGSRTVRPIDLDVTTLGTFDGHVEIACAEQTPWRCLNRSCLYVRTSVKSARIAGLSLLLKPSM
jgi:hypothetical protein